MNHRFPRILPNFRLTTLFRARALCTLLFLCCVSMPALAVNLPEGFSESIFASNIPAPTAMTFAPDGRLFVCQQGGQLRVIKNGILLPTPALTVAVDTSGERGLSGVALHPDQANNPYVYVYYTVPGGAIHNRLSRFTLAGDVAVPGSELIMLELNPVSASLHNGGAMSFGPDGKLYVMVGEGGNAPNAQSLNTLLGKVLRLNADGTIPADNPFYNVTTGDNRAIWAMGLRNPFTFAIQPGTGRIFINDVGNTQVEEINEGAAGANYGWPNCEGPCATGGMTSPAYSYLHGGGETRGCAIVGGTFYDPPVSQFPTAYAGKYFFADFCGGWINYIDPANPPAQNGASVFATGLAGPVDLKTGPDGALYFLQRGFDGEVRRIQYGTTQAPVITAHPVSQTVSHDQPVTFSVGVAGSTPLTLQWQRDGVNIPGAAQTSYTIATVMLADSGAQFRCVVTNPLGVITSNAAVLTVSSDRLPTASITAPVVDTLYAGGDTITYAGTGTDPEDGTLAPGAMSWRVDFHHNTHVHPFVAPITGVSGGSFVIPTIGEPATDVWYRISLTVTDRAGNKHTALRDVRPRVVTLTLTAGVAGARLTLDGQPFTAPLTTQSVVGIERAIGVLTPQTVNGVNYTFGSWSDGGAAAHTIAIPAQNTTYTAAFVTGCSITVAPASRGFGVTGGAGTISVTADAGCDWQVSGVPAWITIVSGASGTGSGTVSYTVAANPDLQPRAATMFIGGRAVTMTQTHDTDNDGIPDLLEPLEGRNALVKDNDIFTSSRLFVMQQYRDNINREADPDGLAYWKGQLDSGINDRAMVLNRFFDSGEYGEFLPRIARLYFAVFQRIPDAGGLNYWMGQLRQGRALTDIAGVFVNAAEFTGRYGVLSNSGYVTRVYRNTLGRDPGATELDLWTDQLDLGQLSRGQMLVTFSEALEYEMATRDKVFVVSLYHLMLRRTVEQDGFDFWVGKLATGRTRPQVIQNFMNGTEYRKRFLP
ncbi:MAG: PQQ-dependent sugar dehydrogenase [Blastocatellia bacterium]